MYNLLEVSLKCVIYGEYCRRRYRRYVPRTIGKYFYFLSTDTDRLGCNYLLIKITVQRGF